MDKTKTNVPAAPPEPPVAPQVAGDGILVALGAEFPGEWVKFKRDWLFGEIDDIGIYIPGTRFAIAATVKMVVDWNIKDKDGATIAFDAAALAINLSILRTLTAPRARALCSVAFAAYAAASRPDPLL